MSGADERLPFVDEHATIAAADVESTWAALLRTAERTTGGAVSARFARLLGCADVAAGGPRPLAVGSTVPGFHVAALRPGEELALAGRHRFAEYALIFRLEPAGAGTRVRAETRAEFPGLKGRAYRALVIGSRGHVLATRRILAAVRERAERR